MEKIIFLDVDGVVLPARSYFLGRENMKWDELAVAMVKRLCERTGAKIVMNSTWASRKKHNMRDILCLNGIPYEMLYQPKTGNALKDIKDSDWRAYPWLSRDRLTAIEIWLSDHPEVTHWVALDDAPIKHKQAILVDCENGLSVDDYRKATELLGGDDKFLVLI